MVWVGGGSRICGSENAKCPMTNASFSTLTERSWVYYCDLARYCSIFTYNIILNRCRFFFFFKTILSLSFLDKFRFVRGVILSMHLISNFTNSYLYVRCFSTLVRVHACSESKFIDTLDLYSVVKRDENIINSHIFKLIA